MKKVRPRITEAEFRLIESYRNLDKTRNVLVIGDLHEPFCRKDYLEHCIQVYSEFDCNHVIFIGDIIDNHYASYHETDPDGMGGGDELDLTIKKIAKWYDMFPKADVVLGNHDRVVMRKAFSGGISKRWIRDFGDVLETPGWNFELDFEYDNVVYTHGEGGGGINGALQKALNKRKSIVQGHWHTECHVRWNVSDIDRVFALQPGCGVDDRAYALAYAKNVTKKSIISCGVVKYNGTLPIIIPMDL